MTPKHRAGAAAGRVATRPQCLRPGAASWPRRGAEPRAAPWPLCCPKPSLPTCFNSVFTTSKAHPVTGQALQQSTTLRPSRCSLFGTGRPHLPQRQMEILMFYSPKLNSWLHSVRHVSVFAVPTPSPCASFAGKAKRHLILRVHRWSSLCCSATSARLSPSPGRKEMESLANSAAYALPV